MEKDEVKRSRRKQKGDWFRKPAAAVEEYLRPSDGLWAAFCVPVVVMIIIFIQRGIFPFGEESFLRTDMYHQYAPFFSEFQYKLTQGGSLLYSWDIGMGVNFSALYAYYLASPFNWLLLLCPKGLVIEFMTYGIVLKTGLSGLAFAWYLKKHCRSDSFGVGFFGIFYALSGYMAAYSWNIMWLDCIILFPVIMFGLERLVKGKRGELYCLALGASILSNYYISIMICIFMVIYFGALLILETGKGKRAKDYRTNMVQFTIYSLLAGGLAAAVLIPAVYGLGMTASADSDFPKTISSYFSIFDMFARHIGNVETEIGLDHWPNIYCGVAVLMFFLLYLGCKHIRLKEKAVYCGLLLLFFASFSVNGLNFLWHGFHFPNSLPCRQSFIYIFLMLVICYRAYMNLKRIPWKHVVYAFWGAVMFVILAEKLVEQEHFEFYTYYVALVFLSLYGGLLYLYKKRKAGLGSITVLALLLVSVEAAINTTVTSITTTSRTSYVKDNKDVRELVESLVPSSTFYRIEKVDRKTKNDGAWMNFPSVSLFSSTANADLTEFFKDIGCEGNTNAYSITGSTPLVDSLFSVKYGLYSSEQEDEKMLELVDEKGDTWLYRRLATLPVGFVVSSDLEMDWQRDLGNPAEVQNNLCDVIGAERVLLDAGGENNGTSFRFTPTERGDYYVYITNKKVKEVKVKIGEDTRTFKNVNRGFLLELGICEADWEISITNEEGEESLGARAYRFSNEGLESVYGILNRYPIEITRWVDTRLEGEIETDQAGVLFTSIPYDKGWKVAVDGIKQETGKIFDAFLSVEMPEGRHTISLTYEPEGLKLGFGISGASILCLVFMAFAAGRKGRPRKKTETESFEEAEETGRQIGKTEKAERGE
ncbi:MAG: YfhO family protein [Hungatella sp.]|nr:YfhO family protein [Hungatella sp.]